jgi:hypothetical protein
VPTRPRHGQAGNGPGHRTAQRRQLQGQRHHPQTPASARSPPKTTAESSSCWPSPASEDSPADVTGGSPAVATTAGDPHLRMDRRFDSGGGLHQQGKPACRRAGGGGSSSRRRSRSRPPGDGRRSRPLLEAASVLGLHQPLSSYEVRFPVAERTGRHTNHDVPGARFGSAHAPGVASPQILDADCFGHADGSRRAHRYRQIVSSWGHTDRERDRTPGHT